MWKKLVPSTPLADERVERPGKLFVFRFWSVPDPIPRTGVDTDLARRPKSRMRLQIFHMRYPCPRGEGWHHRCCCCCPVTESYFCASFATCSRIGRQVFC